MSESKRERYIRLLKSKADLNFVELTFCAVKEIIELLEEPERKKGKWNPCSERLPDKPGSYICTCSDGTPYPKVTVIKFHPRTKAWELNGTRAYWKVRAWMPLPEPYNGEQK